VLDGQLKSSSVRPWGPTRSEERLLLLDSFLGFVWLGYIWLGYRAAVEDSEALPGPCVVLGEYQRPNPDGSLHIWERMHAYARANWTEKETRLAELALD
jgi:hypothetical protein